MPGCWPAPTRTSSLLTCQKPSAQARRQLLNVPSVARLTSSATPARSLSGSAGAVAREETGWTISRSSASLSLWRRFSSWPRRLESVSSSASPISRTIRPTPSALISWKLLRASSSRS